MKPRYFPPDAVLFPEADAVPIPKRVCDTSTWGIVREDTEREIDLAVTGWWEPEDAAIWGCWLAYMPAPLACHVTEREDVEGYVRLIARCLRQIRTAILDMELIEMPREVDAEEHREAA